MSALSAASLWNNESVTPSPISMTNKERSDFHAVCARQKSEQVLQESDSRLVLYYVTGIEFVASESV